MQRTLLTEEGGCGGLEVALRACLAFVCVARARLQALEVPGDTRHTLGRRRCTLSRAAAIDLERVARLLCCVGVAHTGLPRLAS